MLKEYQGRLIDEETGRQVVLHGVNRCGLECWEYGEESVYRVIQVILDDWHADTLRLPVCEDRWFGYSRYGLEGYRNIVDHIVDMCAERKKYLILDCHHSNMGEWGKNAGAHRMADVNTIAFWKDAATRYRNHPYVLFGLYNEPQDISWEVWQKGGWIEENGHTYYAVGMQELLDTVRSTGAKNLVIPGGLVWASLTNGPMLGYDLSDPTGNGIMMDAHIYPWNGMDWDNDFGSVYPLHPVLVGEFGHQGKDSYMGPACMPRMPYEEWMPRLIKWLEKTGFSWCAWCFDDHAGPCLLKDIMTYEPTECHGVYVKNMLEQAWKESQSKV